MKLTSLDDTLLALPPGQTIRPENVATPPGPPGIRDELPRLALVPSDAALGAPQEGPRPDIEVCGTLGEGGMGRVLLARQRSLSREVAVKTTRPGAPAEEGERLLAEGRVTGSLEHPGIVPIHALGLSRDGEPLLIMKRVAGVSLRDLLRDRRHPMLGLFPGGREDPLRGILWILAQVCNAAHFAHSKRVVHRDIKPDNIMVGSFGEVYLLDFGVAALLPEQGELRVADGELAGTPAYMAPEMVSAAAGAIDARTDVYLLGATLHEVLTGSPRHEGADLMEVLQAALVSAPPRYGPDMPPELAALCQRATAPDPAQRPESALRFRQALDDYLKHRGAEVLTASAEERLADLTRLARAREVDRSALKRIGIECRFAYEMALREWPESPRAGQGRERCLRVLFEEALGERDAHEAGALLAEMVRPDEDLSHRLEVLRAELRAEEARALSLRQMEHNLDERVGARARMYLGVLLLSTLLAFRYYQDGPKLPTHREMLTFSAITVAGGALVAALLWRRLLGNAASKRMLGLIFVFLVMMLINRGFASRQGVDVPEALTRELLIGTGVLAATAIGVSAKVWPSALLCLCGALLALFFPAYLAAIFPLTLVGLILLYILVSLRQERSATRSGA